MSRENNHARVAQADEIRESPLTPRGELDEAALVTGTIYRLFHSTLWRWNGRELVSVGSGGAEAN